MIMGFIHFFFLNSALWETRHSLGENICKHISGKGLASRMYIEPLSSIIKDNALNKKGKQNIWPNPSVKKPISKCKDAEHTQSTWKWELKTQWDTTTYLLEWLKFFFKGKKKENKHG